MPSALQLFLDNCAHLLKHCPQQYPWLRCWADPCYVDQQEIRLISLESPAAMVAFESVAKTKPALVVQHIAVVLSR
jgi:hypothetical protein